MKRLTMLIAAAASFACASSTKLPPSGATSYGTYHFREHIANAQPAVTVEGDVVILPDTIIVTTTMAPCAYGQASKDHRTISYKCGAAAVMVHRLDPLRQSSYVVRASEIVTQRVCAATTMVKGVDRCSRYEERRVSREVMRSGKLALQAP